MPKFFLFWRWQWVLRGARLATRHAIILVMLTVILAGSALSSQLLGVFAHSPCSVGDQTYTVNWGNTLSGIAWRYHTTWQRLASYNHLFNANLIFPGQVMCIPSHTQRSGGSMSRSQYVNLARQDALNAGISPDIFVRQINEESGFNPNAISPAGAIGIAQFMPATAAAVGVDPRDPVDALRGAARLMSQYFRQYGGDYAQALAAYNAGPGWVALAIYFGGWNWRAYLPYETQNYIRIILG